MRTPKVGGHDVISLVMKFFRCPKVLLQISNVLSLDDNADQHCKR
jgi:hypothetical protein